MLYASPNTPGAKIAYKAKYDNFIGGKFVAPVKGQYFDVLTPISGRPYTKAARSTSEDIELALDAAHAAFEMNVRATVKALFRAGDPAGRGQPAFTAAAIGTFQLFRSHARPLVRMNNGARGSLFTAWDASSFAASVRTRAASGAGV
jgi:hypothetical protein